MKVEHTFKIENADISKTAAQVLEDYRLPEESKLKFEKTADFFVYLSEPLREAEYRWHKFVASQEESDIYAQPKARENDRILNEALAFLHCCLSNFELCVESHNFVVGHRYGHLGVTFPNNVVDKVPGMSQSQHRMMVAREVIFPDKIIERVTELYKNLAQYLKERAKSILALKKEVEGAKECLAGLELAEILGRMLALVLEKVQGKAGVEHCSIGKLVALVRRDQAKAYIALAERSEAVINKAGREQKRIHKLRKLAVRLTEEPVGDLVTSILYTADMSHGAVSSQTFCEPLVRFRDCFEGIDTQENYGLFITMSAFRSEVNPDAIPDEAGRSRKNNRAKVESEIVHLGQKAVFDVLLDWSDELWKAVIANQQLKRSCDGVHIPQLRLCQDNRVIHINRLDIVLEFKKISSDDDSVILSVPGAAC